jgi:hypothetical protein
MTGDLEKAPEFVDGLAKRCLVHIKNRIGVELEYQEETLSVLDCFVESVVNEEGGGIAPAPGDQTRAHLIHLLAPTIGAYFGEVLRRTFPCRWRVTSEDPATWFMEFELVPLRFNPVGAAGEALLGDTLPDMNGAIMTEPVQMEALFERFAAAPPVPEDEFYSLTTRFEVLQIAQEYLHMRQMTVESGPKHPFFSEEDYDRIFG